MPEDGPRDAVFFVGSIARQHVVVVVLASRFDLGIADNDITESYPLSLLGPSMVASDLADKNCTKLGHAEEKIPEDSVIKEQLKALGFHCISYPNNDPEEEYIGAFGFPYTTCPQYYPGINKEDLPEMKKEDLEAFGFPCAPCPKYYPEIKKEDLEAFGFPCAPSLKCYPEIKKEDLEALGFHFISSPKSVAEISKEDLEALGFRFISTPSDVPENKKEHLQALGIHFITSPKNAPGIKKECPELWRFDVATYPKFISGIPRLSPSLHVVGTPPTSGNSMDADFILYLDSGAGHHVVHQDRLLINPRDPPPGLTRVKAADGSFLTVSGFGDIQTKHFRIPDVCLVKGLKANLVSVGQLVSSRKISCTFSSEGCDVISYDDGSLVGSAVLRGDNQYVLSFLDIQ